MCVSTDVYVFILHLFQVLRFFPRLPCIGVIPRWQNHRKCLSHLVRPSLRNELGQLLEQDIVARGVEVKSCMTVSEE
jgi:hypothetical protein